MLLLRGRVLCARACWRSCAAACGVCWRCSVPVAGRPSARHAAVGTTSRPVGGGKSGHFQSRLWEGRGGEPSVPHSTVKASRTKRGCDPDGNEEIVHGRPVMPVRARRRFQPPLASVSPPVGACARARFGGGAGGADSRRARAPAGWASARQSAAKDSRARSFAGRTALFKLFKRGSRRHGVVTAWSRRGHGVVAHFKLFKRGSRSHGVVTAWSRRGHGVVAAWSRRSRAFQAVQAGIA